MRFTETFNVYSQAGAVVETRTVTYDTSPEQDNETTLNDRATAALVDLRTLRDTTGTLTNTQIANGLRLLARVCLGLVRLQLRRLEGTD